MQFTEAEKLFALSESLKELHRIMMKENEAMFARHDKATKETLISFGQHMKSLGEICFEEINALKHAMLGICVLVFETLPPEMKEAYKEQRNQAMEILTRNFEKPKGPLQ